MWVTENKYCYCLPENIRKYDNSVYVVKLNLLYFCSRDKEIIQRDMWQKIRNNMIIKLVYNIAMLYNGYH